LDNKKKLIIEEE